MRVRELLLEKGSTVITIHADTPLPGAIDILRSKQIGALVVLDATEQVIGILSERDIIRGFADHGAQTLGLQVKDLMTAHVFVCHPGDSLKQIMTRMTLQRVRHLPVVEDNRLVGIISIGDVVKHRLAEMETEANVLRDLVIAHH